MREIYSRQLSDEALCDRGRVKNGIENEAMRQGFPFGKTFFCQDPARSRSSVLNRKVTPAGRLVKMRPNYLIRLNFLAVPIGA